MDTVFLGVLAGLLNENQFLCETTSDRLFFKSNGSFQDVDTFNMKVFPPSLVLFTIVEA